VKFKAFFRKGKFIQQDAANPVNPQKLFIANLGNVGVGESCFLSVQIKQLIPGPLGTFLCYLAAMNR